ncbi:MAG: response regulator [Pseudomonadota bacterium]|nr:response regulator [Pseudomonadota bacterium]
MTSLTSKRIIAIDDTHSILTFLRISLEALGVEFHGAATAAGGIALCETAQPDLVVLDLGLPDQEGLNILPRLKRLYKDRNLPVIVLTVRKEQESLEAASKLGANAYVTKPFIMDDLIEVIRRCLDGGNNHSKRDAKSTGTAAFAGTA